MKKKLSSCIRQVTTENPA